jgi:hypothetical protein
MKTMTEIDLVRLTGGGDPISQPLTMPSGWGPYLPSVDSATALNELLRHFLPQPAV